MSADEQTITSIQIDCKWSL